MMLIAEEDELNVAEGGFHVGQNITVCCNAFHFVDGKSRTLGILSPRTLRNLIHVAHGR
jgi:hypothetical protein